jgi:hypothetical protein
MEQSDSTGEVTPYEQSDSTGEPTPYELATLASRICPKRCVSDPRGAIDAAERLLKEADAAIGRTYQEERQKEWEDYLAQAPRIKWVKAVKQITGQKRRDRAEKRFLEFIEQTRPRGSKWMLERFMSDGFIEDYDIHNLQREFINWLKKPKRNKGKQGRRVSDHDGRLRTELAGLVPRKPRKRV